MDAGLESVGRDPDGASNVNGFEFAALDQAPHGCPRYGEYVLGIFDSEKSGRSVATPEVSVVFLGYQV